MELLQVFKWLQALNYNICIISRWMGKFGDWILTGRRTCASIMQWTVTVATRLAIVINWNRLYWLIKKDRTCAKIRWNFRLIVLLPVCRRRAWLPPTYHGWMLYWHRYLNPCHSVRWHTATQSNVAAWADISMGSKLRGTFDSTSRIGCSHPFSILALCGPHH